MLKINVWFQKDDLSLVCERKPRVNKDSSFTFYFSYGEFRPSVYTTEMNACLASEPKRIYRAESARQFRGQHMYT